VAPTGILEVTTDVVDPALITSAQFGSMVFSASDPSQFRIVPRKDATGNVVVALRIPGNTQPGWYKLRLTGPAGTGDKTPIDVAIPKFPVPPAPLQSCAPAAPPTPTALVARSLFATVGWFWFPYPSLSGDYDGTFPLGSSNARELLSLSCHADPVAAGEWNYDLEETKPSGIGDMCALSLEPKAFKGFEVYCPRAEDCSMGHVRSNFDCPGPGPTPGVHCFPLTGTFQLSSHANQMTVFIDRGQGPEEYVGGWGLGDELAPPRSEEFDGKTKAILLLRSKRTGLQISIAQSIRTISDCQYPRSLP
jgi:hypothetical protein